MKPACGPDFLGPLLGHATHLARERMDARLSRYDMTPSQTHTLLYLSSHGYTAPQRDVVEAAFQEAEAVMVKGLRLEETEALRLLLYRVIENLEEDRTTC